MQWCTYNSLVWTAENIKRNCQMCHSSPSYFIDSAPREGCEIQKRKLLNTGIICQACHNSINWHTKKVKLVLNNKTDFFVQHATYYNSPISDYIKAFKFNKDMSVLPVLVHVLRQLQLPANLNASNSVIIPMPTTTQRIVYRGFDPVIVLSQYLSKHFEIPIWKGVKRIENGVRQVGLTRHQRMHNLEGVFRVERLPDVSNIIIFDDVMTTGSSIKELANSILIHLHCSLESKGFIRNNKQISLYGLCLAHGR